MSEVIDISLGLQNCLAVVTGAGGQIGGVVVKALLAAGCFVTGLDINETNFTIRHENLFWQRVDVTDEAALENAFNIAQNKFDQVVAICIAAAGLDLSFIDHRRSIIDLPSEQFRRTLEVNTTGSFLTAKIWSKNLQVHATSSTRNASLILFGSEAGTIGVPGNPDYSASKAAIQYGLVRSLAPDAANIFDRARVNAIAPGAVDTKQFRKECAEAVNNQVEWREAQATVAVKRAIPMEDIAKVCLMLASESFTSSITGQLIPIDGGKSGRLLWNFDGSPTW